MTTFVRSGSHASTRTWSQDFNNTASQGSDSGVAAIDLPTEGIVMVQASGSKDKLLDARRAMAGYDTYVVLAKDFLGRTLPDDDERADNQYQIVKDKIKTTVRDVWESMTPTEKSQSMDRLKKILRLRADAEFSGAELADRLAKIANLTPGHIVIFSEDRGADMDRVIRDHDQVRHIWDDLRNSSDPLVKEAFKPDHSWTGKRVKEVMSAAGGAVYFLERDAAARKILRDAGVPFTEYHKMRVVSRYETLEPGLIRGLEPEAGLVVEAVETHFRYRPLTKTDWYLAGRGKEFDFSHFEIPQTPEAEGTTAEGNPVTIDDLRENPDSQYLNTHYVASVVLHEFAAAAGLPKLQNRRKYGSVNIPEARVITNENVGEWSDQRALTHHVGNYKRALFRERIESLATLERTFYHGEALVIRDPNKWPVPEGVDPEEFRRIKNLEARLLFSYWGMLKPHGSSQVAGRPILVEKSFADRELGYYSDFSNRKTISHPRKEVWDTFDGDTPDNGAAEINEKMRWDPDRFKENPKDPSQIPEFKLITEEEMLAAVGREDIGFTTSMIGTAGSKIVEGNRDAYTGSLLSAQAGFTTMSGGGAREEMKRFFDGHVDVWLGNQPSGLKIGVRTPVVSHNEGSITIYMKDRDLQADAGTDPQSPHFSLCQGTIHVFEMPYMCQRQHFVMAPAHVSRKFPGGIGTENEDETVRLHNLYVAARGYGMFPGFSNNTKPKNVHWVNTTIVNGRTSGYLDRAMEDVSASDRAASRISIYATPQEEFEACRQLAKTLGYPVAPVADIQAFLANSNPPPSASGYEIKISGPGLD